MTRNFLRKLGLGFCVLVAAVFAALWIRGFFVKDQVCVRTGAGGFVFISQPHHLFVTYVSDVLPRIETSWKNWDTPIPARMEYLELRVVRDPTGWSLWLPHWLPILLVSGGPGWVLITRKLRRDRERRGLCASCGYDLRASTNCCPECGAPITAMTPIAQGNTDYRLSPRS